MMIRTLESEIVTLSHRLIIPHKGGFSPLNVPDYDLKKLLILRWKKAVVLPAVRISDSTPPPSGERCEIWLRSGGE